MPRNSIKNEKPAIKGHLIAYQLVLTVESMLRLDLRMIQLRMKSQWKLYLMNQLMSTAGIMPRQSEVSDELTLFLQIRAIWIEWEKEKILKPLEFIAEANFRFQQFILLISCTSMILLYWEWSKNCIASNVGFKCELWWID